MNGEQRAVLVVGLVAAAWWWSRGENRPLVPSVTTSETFDLPGSGPTSFSPAIKRMAQAIARAEGFHVAGSIPQRANNPGDLKVPGTVSLPGVPPGESGITKFPSADAGWAALHKQLYLILTGKSRIYTLDMTIRDMAAAWAADSGPWASNVARYLGVSLDTPLWQVLA